MVRYWESYCKGEEGWDREWREAYDANSEQRVSLKVEHISSLKNAQVRTGRNCVYFGGTMPAERGPGQETNLRKEQQE